MAFNVHPWATDAIDERIRVMASEGKSNFAMAKAIYEEFDVMLTKGHIIRRKLTLRIPPGAIIIPRVPPPDLTPCLEVPVWKSPEADALFSRDWVRGCSVRALRGRWDITEWTMTLQRKALDLKPRATNFHTYVKAEPKPKPTPPPAPTKERAPPPRVSDRKHTASETFLRQNVFIMRGGLSSTKTGVVKAHTEGACKWALTCHEPAAAGNWCVHHAALIRAVGKRAA